MNVKREAVGILATFLLAIPLVAGGFWVVKSLISGPVESSAKESTELASYVISDHPFKFMEDNSKSLQGIQNFIADKDDVEEMLLEEDEDEEEVGEEEAIVMEDIEEDTTSTTGTTSTTVVNNGSQNTSEKTTKVNIVVSKPKETTGKEKDKKQPTVTKPDTEKPSIGPTKPPVKEEVGKAPTEPPVKEEEKEKEEVEEEGAKDNEDTPADPDAENQE